MMGLRVAAFKSYLQHFHHQPEDLANIYREEISVSEKIDPFVSSEFCPQLCVALTASLF